jgi:AraC family transcriptional regulator, transcriptional activator of pobA
MSAIVALQTFYNKIPALPFVPKISEAGHFNVFKVDGLLSPEYKKGPYNRRTFYKVSLLTGHSKIHYADQTIEVTDSVLVFTNPMVPYSWELTGETQTGYFCIFTAPFFNRFENIKDYPVFQSADTAVILLTATETVQYNALFVRMFNELQSDYAYKHDLLRNLLMEVIHAAQKMQPAVGSIVSGATASERIASLFAELQDRQFSAENTLLKSPSDFARQLNIHVNHLNKALKEITGKTTTQLINDRILQEARILLRNTSLTIAETGWRLGFEAANHFSGFFKNRTGITPTAYRQSKID